MKTLIFFLLLVAAVSDADYCGIFETEPQALLCRSLELKPDEPIPVTHNNTFEYLALQAVSGTIGLRTLSSMSRLKQLLIQRSHINAIEDGALCTPPNLEYLSLRENEEFPVLTQSMFGNCNTLTYLLIGNMKFHKTAFHSLPNLQDIAFEGLQIPRFEKEYLEKLHELKNIEFRKCEIGGFESGSLCFSPNLDFIEMSNNYLLPLTKELSENCKFVKTFKYEQNKEFELKEKAFAGFVNLTTAWISNLKIKHLTKGHLEGFANLESLKLIASGIDTIDEDAFDVLKKLKSLDLSNNNLTEIDSSVFSPLTGLVGLTLRGNNIQNIDHFKNNVIKNLEVGFNNISKIDVEAVRLNLPNLVRLLAAGNKMTREYEAELHQKFDTKNIKFY